MSLEKFREECNKGRFYFFETLQDFDKRKDYNGTNLSKKVLFENGVEECKGNPTPRMAYGISL